MKRVCSQCRALVDSVGYQRHYEACRNRKRQGEFSFYSSAGWQGLRRQVVAASVACHWCGSAGVPLTADHVRTIRTRPDLALDPSNVVAACRSCQVKRQYQPGGGRTTR